MSTTSDSASSEVLRLYEMIKHKISNNRQPINVFDYVSANWNYLCSYSQERVCKQLQQVPQDAMERCIEGFRQLRSHLSVLSKRNSFNMGFERTFAILFGQDVHIFQAQ